MRALIRPLPVGQSHPSKRAGLPRATQDPRKRPAGRLVRDMRAVRAGHGRGGSPDGSSVAARDQRPSPPAEELSPGELRVLRYLPSNLSRPQIASGLSVSVNTVSTHIRSIYAKLGTEDRSAAVRRARELRLLSGVRTLASR